MIAKFDLMNSVISPAVVILMEVLWLYPWLILSNKMGLFELDQVPLSLNSCFLLITLPYIITRFIPARGKLEAAGKILLVLLTILIVVHIEYVTGLIPLSGEWFVYMGRLIIDSFSVFHPIAPALLVSAYLCWRGIRLGITGNFLGDVYRSFMFGLAATVIMIIIWTTSLGKGSINTLAANVGLYVAGFFFFGLISLALGNFLDIRQKLLQQQATPLSSRRMLSILLLIIGGIVAVGMTVVGLFSPGFASAITGFFGNIVHYLNYPLQYLFIPIEWLGNLLYQIMAFFVNLFGTDKLMEEFFVTDFSIDGTEELPTAPQNGFDIMLLMKWISFVIILAFVVYLLVRASRRFLSRADEGDVEEISESLWSWLGFKTDFFLFFRRLFNKWFGEGAMRFKAGIPSLRRKETQFPDDMDIREIYRHVLNESSESGFRHMPFETPYEFAKRLDRAIPGIDEQMDDITDLYVNVRYGESSLKEWETEHANVLFRLIRRVFNKPGGKPGDPMIP